MKLHTTLVKNIFLFIIVTAILSSCTASSEKVFSMDVAATLKDRNHMAVTIDIVFKKKTGVAEALKKKQKIRYAVSLIYREYTSEQVLGLTRNSMNSTIRAILVRVLDSEIKSVRASVLSIDGKKIALVNK